MAAISTVLSQHALLTSLCANLSAADIVHLAATSKEHRTYVTSSKRIYDMLKSNAVCDGLGVVARARAFGEGNGNPMNVKEKCLGAAAKPCSDCHAPVCNNCRFHFYPHLAEDEDEERDVVNVEEDDGVVNGELSSGNPVSIKRAFWIYWQTRCQVFCEDCHPLWTPHTNRHQRCPCDFYDHFVGERWLCMPCFFVEETNAAQFSIQFTPKIRMCDCGKASMVGSDEICRRCHKAQCWNSGQVMLPKILAQLG